jgi:hypothetical protein
LINDVKFLIINIFFLSSLINIKEKNKTPMFVKIFLFIFYSPLCLGCQSKTLLSPSSLFLR